MSSYEPYKQRILLQIDGGNILTNPKPMPKPKKEETIHHKMYEIATSKYNPFSVGGSESIHDFEGGSENLVDR